MGDSTITPFPTPPDWSLNVGDLGRALVLVAVFCFVFAVAILLNGTATAKAHRFGTWLFGAGCVSLLGAFVSLGVLFGANRFEYNYIWEHGDLKNALQYRIAGIWSGQQGSFLLWACASAVFALASIRFVGQYRRWFVVVYSVFLGALAGILAFESPFELNLINGRPFVPPDGQGLAPSLQNYWVTIHPPTIFLGFGSLTVLFALAVAAMIQRDYERWIPIVRPWAILSLTFVGLGLCMGGFWAYETLGWGGFWMWDPVENVSFVPWCFAAAFVHGVIVQSTRKRWQLANLLMGGLPFITFVYGTFLTRSGLLADASVHSFAEMDRSALKLLVGVMGVSTLGFLGLWAWRAFQARKEPSEKIDETYGVTREGFYQAGVLLLTVLGLATMIGMSVPLVMALKGEKPRVVEEGLYHQVLPYIFVPIMLLMASAPFVSWRAMPARQLLIRIYGVLCLTVAATGMTFLMAVVTPYRKVIDLDMVIKLPGGHEVKGSTWMLFLMGLCFFVLIANVWRIAEMIKRSKMGVASFLAHVGVAVLMAGLILSRGFEKKEEGMVVRGEPVNVLGYLVAFEGTTKTMADRDNRAKFLLVDSDGSSFTAYPGMYTVKTGDRQTNTMVWPYIRHSLLSDLYFSIRPPEKGVSDPLRLAPGETGALGQMKLTYVEMTHAGQFGQPGSSFGAKIKVQTTQGEAVVNPTLELGADGPAPHPVQLSDNVDLAMVSLNAADKSVTLQLEADNMIYPVEIFHKPLTSLVWLGTGIMALAGFLSALYRRTPRQLIDLADAPVSEEVKPEPSTNGKGSARPSKVKR